MLLKTKTANLVYSFVISKFSLFMLLMCTQEAKGSDDFHEITRPRTIALLSHPVQASKYTLAYNPHLCKYQDACHAVMVAETQENTIPDVHILYRQLMARLSGGYDFDGIIENPQLDRPYQLYRAGRRFNSEHPVDMKQDSELPPTTPPLLRLIPYDIFEMILQYLDLPSQNNASQSDKHLLCWVYRYWGKTTLASFVLVSPSIQDLRLGLEKAFEFVEVQNKLFVTINNITWQITANIFGPQIDGLNQLSQLAPLIAQFIEYMKDPKPNHMPEIALQSYRLEEDKSNPANTDKSYTLSLTYFIDYVNGKLSARERASILSHHNKTKSLSQITLSRKIFVRNKFCLDFHSAQPDNAFLNRADRVIDEGVISWKANSTNTCNFDKIPYTDTGQSVKQRQQMWLRQSSNVKPYLPNGFSIVIDHRPINTRIGK